MSAFITPGSEIGIQFFVKTISDSNFLDTKFVLLHEAKNDEGIKSFFLDVWELYVKVSPNSDDQQPLMCVLDDAQSISFEPTNDTEFYVWFSGTGECEEIFVITG